MARHPKEHYKMKSNAQPRYSEEERGGGSPSMGHRGKVPTTISNDFKKHANLPTDASFMNYPYCDYMDQYVGDSIVEADRTQDMGVREMRRQASMEKY
ncbi:hypothetical protein UFOVP97_53 [uncultured Caudovirales phage]|uniref:Uncharacterized protein n=1 Tax=uncultured Caudovirales phage TaxID=2100421 RepID=A0A6J5LM70_9CAUD|nr:hypothetical protein UFOVP97_53 [uncultured Caudovirales phage]CAB4134090.1 hypothetical protein UFOVP268_15 [uncultured Caudovirales phage]